MSANMKLILENWERIIVENDQNAQKEDKIAAQFAAQIQALSKQLGQQRQKQQSQQQGQLPVKQLDEVDPATLAGLAIAAPAILTLIDKVIRWGRWLFSDDEVVRDPTIIGKVGEKMHHKYQNVVASALPNLIPEMGYLTPEAKKKMADIVMMIITVKMAVLSGAQAIDAARHAHAGHAAFEGALTAVKTGEVGAFIAGELKAVASAAGVVARAV
jgi:hypothetical protein